MLALVAAAALSATPRPHPDATFAVFVPRMDKATGLGAFLRSAGKHSALLRPEGLRSEFHPLLSVDFTQVDSLTDAGMDPAGAATVSLGADLKVSCTQLKDVKRFEARAAERMAPLGKVWSAKLQGARVAAVVTADQVVAGYALKGTEACAVVTPGDKPQAALAPVARLLDTPKLSPLWKTAAALPGQAVVVTGKGATALSGTERSLTAEGQTSQLPVPAMRGAGVSPFANAAPSGLLFARVRVDPSQTDLLVAAVEQQLRAACPDCMSENMRAIAQPLAKRLTGNVLLRIDRAGVKDSLKTESGRYFALKHAFIAEVSDAAAVKAALDALKDWRIARRTDHGFSLQGKGGEVHVGVRSGHLYFGNDQDAVFSAFDALGSQKPGRQAHGLELSVDPSLVARGLSQVSLLDVMNAKELAGLFAVGTELGPLLHASERITGWADPAGPNAQRFQVGWQLK